MEHSIRHETIAVDMNEQVNDYFLNWYTNNFFVIMYDKLLKIKSFNIVNAQHPVNVFCPEL